MSTVELTRKHRLRNRQVPKKMPGLNSLGQGISREANRRAAAILEVLAGQRTPQQAAVALSISLPYYYLLERKAFQGLLDACEVKPKGPPGPSPERQVALLERELARCKGECQRQAALVRATQRTMGLPAPVAPDKRPAATEGTRPRKNRRPVARALRAAKILRKNADDTEGTPGLERESQEAMAQAPIAIVSKEKETQDEPARG